MIKAFYKQMNKKILTFVFLFTTAFGQSNIFAQFGSSFADIAEEVNESVVTITTTNTIMLDKDIQNFYRYWGRELPDEYESKSLGSGVIVDSENAYINYLQIAYGRVIRFHNQEIKKNLNEDEIDILSLVIINLRQKFNS